MCYMLYDEEVYLLYCGKAEIDFISSITLKYVDLNVFLNLGSSLSACFLQK